MSLVLLRRAAAALLLFGLAVGAGLGQAFRESETEFDAAARKTFPLRKDFFEGREQPDPNNKEHMTAVDHAAKDIVYRLYWNSQGRSVEPKKMFGPVYILESALSRMSGKKREATLKFQQLFTRAVIDRCADVIREGRPIATVNAARMLSLITERRTESGLTTKEKQWAEDVLPRLAEGNADHYVETAVKMLELPKTNDGTRYYLFRGLANLLALPPGDAPLVKKESEEKAVRAALKLVEKDVKFPKAAPREEIEGYKMLRQQAVAVLGGASMPSLGPKERPALALARVAAGGAAVVPAPRVTEQVEATIGLARMTARSKDADLQVDYAAEHVARGVLAFALVANDNLDSGVLGVAKDATAARARPWRVEAARLLEAVEWLKKVKSPYAQSVVAETSKVLKAIEENRPGDSSGLIDWLDRNPAPVKALFKGDPEATVKPGEPPPKEKKEEKKAPPVKDKDKVGKDKKKKK